MKKARHCWRMIIGMFFLFFGAMGLGGCMTNGVPAPPSDQPEDKPTTQPVQKTPATPLRGDIMPTTKPKPPTQNPPSNVVIGDPLPPPPQQPVAKPLLGEVIAEKFEGLSP